MLSLNYTTVVCRTGKINNKDLRFTVLTMIMFLDWLYSVADTNVMEESSFSKNILFYWETLYRKLPYR
jgi:hypothetical protein